MAFAFLMIPASLSLIAAGGAGVCAIAGFGLHLHDMILAGGACLIASELALLPLIIVRGKDQLAVSQAGLVGTMLHLMCIAIIAGVLLVKMHAGTPFVFWLFGFYFASLVVVVASFIAAVKKAPPTRLTASSQG